MTTEKQYHGGCYCGAVRFTLTGPPNGAQACHCSICRRLQGSTFGVEAAFWPRENLTVTDGAELLTEFLSPARYSRNFCHKCGTRAFMSFEKAAMPIPLVAVYPTILDEVYGEPALLPEFKPVRHIYYANRLYDICDGVAKFADMPAEFGGSGQLLSDRGEQLQSEEGAKA